MQAPVPVTMEAPAAHPVHEPASHSQVALSLPSLIADR
jgi:hypothetical protein